MERSGAAARATFFVGETPLEPRAQIVLGESVVRHLRARRLGTGTMVQLVDGMGHRGSALIVREARDSVLVEIGDVDDIAPLPEVHLMVPVADRERMLWLAEKSTELGVTSWRPVLWRRSKSVAPRGEGPMFGARVRGRMIAALEQSGNAHLPQLYPEAPLSRALAAVPGDGTRLVLDPSGLPVFDITVQAPVTLALGPEGGFEDVEMAELRNAGFAVASLGPQILRFETAGTAAVAIARAMLHHQDAAGHVR